MLSVYARDIVNHAESAICFHMGELASYESIPGEISLFRLPFTTCWFEVDDPAVGLKVGILANQLAGQDFLHIILFRRKMRNWDCLGAARITPDLTSNKLLYQTLEVDCLAALSEAGGSLCVFLTAINCCNVTRTEHKPVAALQKARAKRGKQPLFSYWTLDIDLDHEQTDRESMGGTHASPRLHLRRGHARQYAEGKYCWVQPHVVGNKALGMVHKDYRAITSSVAA